MKKSLVVFVLIAGSLMLQFCTASRSAASGKADATMVTYASDVAPILQAHCTPCHFPDGGKMKFLDTQTAVETNIDTILARVQLTPGTDGFMPFKSKKEPLTEAQIATLKAWKAGGMAK